MAKRKRRASAHKKKSKRATRTTRRKRTSKRGRSPARVKSTPQRTIEFHESTKAHIIRDNLSNVRAILYNHQPLSISAKTALDAAKSYLFSHDKYLGLHPSELQNLDHPPEPKPTGAGVEYRLVGENRQFDLSTVTYQQMILGLPVWQGAITVHVKDQPDSKFAVSVVQTSGCDLKPDSISASAESLKENLKRLETIDAETLARHLGIARSREFDVKSLRITYQSPTVYRYVAKKRRRIMPLPRVPAEITEGSFHVVSAVYFDIGRKGSRPRPWMALVECRTLSVLYLDELSAGVTGLVFRADPVTLNGGPTSSASNRELNRFRHPEILPNLILSNPQKLVGTNVEIVDIETPDNVVPTESPGVSFAFNARTDEFAAVNAYYNCDRFFGFVESLGFTRAQYFPKQTFPIKVDARGQTDDDVLGQTADAQTNPKFHHGPGGTWGEIDSVAFLLADANAEKPPLGIACDWRIVLHELAGHGTLLNYVASTHFGFAHSAGDSFAAILSDPESKAKNKGRTFPWLFNQIGLDRMHNRKASGGWAWDGEKDVAPMDQEQILSSTHFRFYQAIGGSDAQLKMRQFAARYASYLILRAIQTLKPSSNPDHAGDWLTRLVAADSGDWTSEGQRGGAYAKVLRWAFEKQGLFRGKPPDVDVYIDDGRKGEYTYNPDYVKCAAIWNRTQPDGKEGHQVPAPNVDNFAYVKVKNRGTSVAKSVTVDAFQANPGSALAYPDDWKKMDTPQLAAPDIPGRSRGIKVGPFHWIPTAGSNAILMAVSTPNDLNNLSNFPPGKSIPHWRLVPNDNNLGMRKV
jgi:hypothetical protein